jgi:hypothetical protein
MTAWTLLLLLFIFFFASFSFAAFCPFRSFPFLPFFLPSVHHLYLSFQVKSEESNNCAAASAPARFCGLCLACTSSQRTAQAARKRDSSTPLQQGEQCDQNRKRKSMTKIEPE